MQKSISLIVACLCFYACVKDKPGTVAPQEVALSSAKKVYIANEGNFNVGNASISLYDPGSGDIVSDLYTAQNGNGIGDVAQSMNYVNGNYYLVVNNSNKILVCDAQFKKIGQISDLRSPRYLLPVSNQKAYVSDLFANAISVINLNSRLKTASIPCPGQTERMAMIYNKVYVTNYDREYVYVVNTLKDQVEDSVWVGKKASSLVVDKNDRVWVLSGSSLSRINALDNRKELSLDFSPGDSPFGLCINKTKDTLYYLNVSVYRFAVSDAHLPAVSFIAAGGRNFYGMGVNPNSHELYLADALDYVQKANVYVFSPAGEQRTVFKAGINANGFYFE